MTLNTPSLRLLRRAARPLAVVLLVLFVSTVAIMYRLSATPAPAPAAPVAPPLPATASPAYQDLTVVTIVEGAWDDAKEEQVRSLVGSLHRYRPHNRASPKVVVFCERPAPVFFLEEASLWEGVSVRLVSSVLGLPIANGIVDMKANGLLVRRVLMETVLDNPNGDSTASNASNANNAVNPVLFVSLGLVFDPLPAAVKEALGKTGTIGNPPPVIRAVFKRVRKVLKSLVVRLQEEGSVVGWSEGGKGEEMVALVEGFGDVDRLRRQTSCLMRAEKDCIEDAFRLKAKEFGFAARTATSDAGCYMDVRPEVIRNAVLNQEADGTSISFPPNGKPNLAIGLPLTSKGSASIDDDPVLLKALVPSLLKTVSKEEFDSFNIILYLAFDHGDALWDNKTRRQEIRQQINNHALQVKMYRMTKGRRVAMLWSMLYTISVSLDRADYFFQVNDDLTLETAGWLSKYVSLLRANGDFGVTGPYDPHNNINCVVLTQAMVSKLHFAIFHTLYPPEMRDWKTDRWLTHVYNDAAYGNNTWCSQEIVARNGGAKTRYKHCEFLSWQLYVEEGRDRIKRWLADNPAFSINKQKGEQKE